MSARESEISAILQAWNRGEPQALETLMPLVIDDLRTIARGYFKSESRDHTLQPTALVNELYLRLNNRHTVTWQSPSHFFGTAAEMMRRLLVDHARRRKAEKRGGDVPKLSLEEDLLVLDRRDPDTVLALDQCLRRLEEFEPRAAQVVSLKMFAGLTIDEISATLEIGKTAVKSDWKFARAWLTKELR